MHYKLTDFHSYLLCSSSHPSHVKIFIPYSQFLRLRRLCTEDSGFSLKAEEMCDFFDKRGYPASVVQAGHHRAQQIDLGNFEYTSLAFLDIKLSIKGNGLCTSVHYKLTDFHSYLLYSSSHPSHVKISIPYSQFLRLRRLCTEDSGFSLKSEEMCHFFDKCG